MPMSKSIQTVYVTGGAGYVGAVLVPKLLAADYHVRVLDLFIYGEDVLPRHPNLTAIKGDLRDAKLLQQTIPGADAVIHLACISNDPSFELNPTLGKSINFDAFEPLVKISRDSGVRRFIYASSSSVYGVKKEDKVTEELSLEPLTDYSRFKAMCEEVLAKHYAPGFTCCHGPSRDRVWLFAAAAPRPDREYSHEPRHQQGTDHGLRRRATATEPPYRRHD